MSSLFWPTINLAVLIGILYKFLNQPIRSMVVGRHETTKKNYFEVQEKLRSARARIAELQAKMQGLNHEVQTIQVEVRRQAEKSRDQILSHSKELASSILGNANQSSENMILSFKSEMRRNFVEKVMAASTEAVSQKLTVDVRQRLAREFSSEVVK